MSLPSQGRGKFCVHSILPDSTCGISLGGVVIVCNEVSINSSITDVLCTATAGELAIGKIVVCADHPSNKFFRAFLKCLTYKISKDFVEKVKEAMSSEPGHFRGTLQAFVGGATTQLFMEYSNLNKVLTSEEEPWKPSLLSIASAADNIIAVYKATQERSIPRTARVKVELDLLAKLMQRMKLQYVDEKSGKIMDHFQEFVYDNLPSYCTFCNHQNYVKSDGQRDQLAIVTAQLDESVGEEPAILDDASIINQALVALQTTNSSARAIVPREVLCLNTFDALTNNIVHVPSESLQLFGEINGMIEVLRKDLMKAKAEEFMNLNQEKMSVKEYALKFT
ncbi:hypothetical protein FXO38_17544 [Capsicum annuum]|uniref:Uncharacterized protein n=1 Tax=Capsicum annuum TaxID=4072 RepID=A0A2G2YR51_CAPAN|nr:hypothetical protein FXO38_17544 [Capsicum annuum]PHT72227.1 hypothetical protein T459_23012 [Capsicum annuum]